MPLMDGALDLGPPGCHCTNCVALNCFVCSFVWFNGVLPYYFQWAIHWQAVPRVKGIQYNLSIMHTVAVNTLRPRQNGRRFPHMFKCIFLNKNVWISLKISLKFVPKVRINNLPALVQITAWCRPGDKPLSEPMMVSLLTHICVTRPQWVKVQTVVWCPSLLPNG